MSLTTEISERLESGHKTALLRVVRELGTEHSLEAILDELSEEDRAHVLTLRPIDLIEPPLGTTPNGRAHAHAPSVPPLSPSTAKAPRSARASKPAKPLAKKAAKKAAAKKPPKAPKAAKAKTRGAKKKAVKASAPEPRAATPAAAAPSAAAPRKADSKKAQIASAVAAHVGKLAKGASFKTGTVLKALGASTKDTSVRVKIVAALRELEEAGTIMQRGSGRASEYVVK